MPAEGIGRGDGGGSQENKTSSARLCADFIVDHRDEKISPSRARPSITNVRYLHSHLDNRA
jgi:hypothetical protein